MLTGLPLAGVRVFELCSNVAGPYGTMILAELGAEVIKIERPGGDDARQWGPPFWKGDGTKYHTVNRNKKSIIVDMKNSEEAATLRKRIVEEGDVVLQNLRPGIVEKFGFSADVLLKENPRLIYCNLHAFGSKGPMKDKPGYDALIQAFGGIISVTGEEGSAPARAGISVIDMGTGMWCAIGILSALYKRQQTGKGGVVDTSLFETALAWMTFHACDYQITGESAIGKGTGVGGVVPYEAFSCEDDYLIIAAANDRLFAKLAHVLEHPEWIKDDFFASNANRDENRIELKKRIESVTKTAPRQVWQEKLDAVGIPNAPIQSIGTVLNHPQTEAIGMAQQTDDPNMKIFGLPISFDGERPPLRNIAPPLPQEDKS